MEELALRVGMCRHTLWICQLNPHLFVPLAYKIFGTFSAPLLLRPPVYHELEGMYPPSYLKTSVDVILFENKEKKVVASLT